MSDEKEKERIYHIPAVKTEEIKEKQKVSKNKAELPEITGSRGERIIKINEVS